MTDITPRALTAPERAQVKRMAETLATDDARPFSIVLAYAALLHAEAERDEARQRLADCGALLDRAIGERDEWKRRYDTTGMPPCSICHVMNHSEQCGCLCHKNTGKLRTTLRAAEQRIAELEAQVLEATRPPFVDVLHEWTA